MREVTLMVSDKTAKYLDKLAQSGHLGGGKEAYKAFELALFSRPIEGERRVKISPYPNWLRLPKNLRFGGK